MADKSITFQLFAKDHASKTFQSFGSQASEAVTGLIKKAAEVAVAYAGIHAVVDFGKDAVEAASLAETANAKLSTSLKDAGYSSTLYQSQIESAEATGRKFGFTNADVATSLANLVTGLQDPNKALSVLSVAEDLARAKGMDLNDAASLVTKGMEGQLKPLKALGIDLPVYAGNSQAVALAQQKVESAQEKVNSILAKTPNAANAASKAHATYEAAVTSLGNAQDVLKAKQQSGGEILEALSQRLKGSASASAETYAGKLATMKAGVDDLEEKVGKALMPALDDLVKDADKYVIPELDKFAGWFTDTGGPAISGFLGWMDKNRDGLIKLVPAAEGAVAVFWLLDAAMDANPVGAVVLGIEALALGIGILVTNIDTVKGMWIGTFTTMEDATLDVWQGLAGAGDNFFNGIAAGLNWMLGPINAIRQTLGLGAISIPKSNVSGLVGMGKQGFDTLAGSLTPAKAGNGVARGNQSSTVHTLAEGAFVPHQPGGIFANIGEGRHDEVVLPLSDQILSKLGGRGGGVHIGTIYQQPNESAAEFAQKLGFYAGAIQ